MIAGREQPTESSAFSEAQLLALMAAMWLTIEVALPVPIWIGFAGVGLAVLLRSPAGFVVSLIMLASGLGAAAEAAYVPADRATLDNASAVMVTDPEPTRFGWRAEARLEAIRKLNPAELCLNRFCQSTYGKCFC